MQELSSLTETATKPRIVRFQSVLRDESDWLNFPPPAPPNLNLFYLNVFIKGHACMAWTAPHFEEIQLNCEINSHAGARL
jgi:hypothetical protein